MSGLANDVLAAVRRAVEISGVDLATDDTIARLKLERQIDIELRCGSIICTDCGDLDGDY